MSVNALRNTNLDSFFFFYRFIKTDRCMLGFLVCRNSLLVCVCLYVCELHSCAQGCCRKFCLIIDPSLDRSRALFRKQKFRSRIWIHWQMIFVWPLCAEFCFKDLTKHHQRAFRVYIFLIIKYKSFLLLSDSCKIDGI